MGKYQTRKVVLRSGRRTIELELGSGHIWEREKHRTSTSTLGHPIYNAKEERDVFARLLRKYQRAGWRVVEDTGLTPAAAAPKKPKDMPARTWRWIADTDQVLEMWLDDDYDNHKDAIMDARDLLRKPPSGQPRRVQRLQLMLEKATHQLRRLAAKDPEIAAYARGLIDLATAGKPRRKREIGRSFADSVDAQ